MSEILLTIEKIVQQALDEGFLTPTMEAEVGRICDTVEELTVEEYMALDRLMGSLLTGEITAFPRKHFINVMEEIVVTEAINRVAKIEQTCQITLDIGDISAYALNRLPPLYATTEEGAQYQRQKIKGGELRKMMDDRLEEAICRYLDRPSFFPERQAISKGNPSGNSITQQISNLLRAYAPDHEDKVELEQVEPVETPMAKGKPV